MPNHAPNPPQRRAILFTAFEPSGDDHAHAVIAELKTRHPDLTIFAWGGPKMAAAGADLVERTGEDAVMGVPGVRKILEHTRINSRLARWLDENQRGSTPVVLHVPVDSPAANGPICVIVRKRKIPVVHLVAPQVWAWGKWRIRKLRRITDFILCLLPFEEAYFRQRRVPCAYIGHFLFDRPLDFAGLDARAATFGTGTPRIAMMPGSRPEELRRHFPILLDAFRELQKTFPHASGVVAATTPAVAENLRTVGLEQLREWPESLRIVTGETDAAVRWCDVALVKSGTVTLQVAKQRKPMVIFYKRSSPIGYLLARSLVSTEFFSLPNLLAGSRIVPELVPHFGDHGPIVQIARTLLTDPLSALAQTQALDRVVRGFDGMNAAKAAADHIERFAGLTPG
jgi:lipid-A-disaccharide synthase